MTKTFEPWHRTLTLACFGEQSDVDFYSHAGGLIRPGDWVRHSGGWLDYGDAPYSSEVYCLSRDWQNFRWNNKVRWYSPVVSKGTDTVRSKSRDYAVAPPTVSGVIEDLFLIGSNAREALTMVNFGIWKPLAKRNKLISY